MATNNLGQGHVRYEVIAQEDGDDIILPIPQILLDQIGWKEGDIIDFGLDDKGHYILRKIG